MPAITITSRGEEPRINHPIPGPELPRGAAALPPKARAKFTALAEQAETLGDASHAAMRRSMAALEQLQRHQAARGELVEALRKAGQRDEHRVAEADRIVAAAQADHARRQLLADEASAAASPLRQLVERLGEFIEQRAGRLQDAAPVKTGTGPPLPQLTSTRLALQTLQVKLASVRDAPPTDAETTAAADRQVAELAARGRPIVGVGARDMWPTTRAQTWIDGRLSGSTSVVDAPAILAWLFPEEMTAKLAAEALAERQGVEPGLPTAERTAELNRLAGEVLALERLEETLITAATAAGSNVQRREDASALAVLAVVEVERAEPATGTGAGSLVRRVLGLGGQAAGGAA